MLRQQKQFGFTIIEVLLVVAIITILTAIVAPLSRNSLIRNDLDNAAISLVQSHRRAKLRAQSGEADSAWGVQISSGKVTIYKGNNYNSRDTQFDEIYYISSSLNIVGLSDISYSKIKGTPSQTGNIAITSTDGGTKNININSEGKIEY